MTRPSVAAALAGLAALVGASSCLSTPADPNLQQYLFACGPGGECPSCTTCAGDGLCHEIYEPGCSDAGAWDGGADAGTPDSGPMGSPDAGPDAGADAGPRDAGPDGGPQGDGGADGGDRGSDAGPVFCAAAEVLAAPRAFSIDAGAFHDRAGGAISADFNGDGALDFAVVNAAVPELTLFLNGRDGGFVRVTAALPFPCELLETADLNHDGRPDLIAGSYLQNDFVELLSEGDGGFGTPERFSADFGTDASFNPVQIRRARLTTDGWDDLAIVNTGSNDLVLCLNDRDGGYLEESIGLDSAGFVQGLAGGDLNNDQLDDFAVVDSFGTLYVYASKPLDDAGHPVYQLGLTVGGLAGGTDPFGGYSAVEIADFDGDGFNDVLALSTSESAVDVYLGQAKGLIQTVPSSYATNDGDAGLAPLGLAVGDINGDGYKDLVAVGGNPQGSLSPFDPPNQALAGFAGSTLSILLFTDAGFADFATRSTPYPGGRWISLGRFFADGGPPDLLLSYAQTSFGFDAGFPESPEVNLYPNACLP